VGVVADFRRRGIERAVGPEFFTAVAGIAETQLIVRAEGEPDRLVSEVEAAVRSAGVAVVSTGMVEAQLGTLSAQRRFQTTLLGLFAGLALLLAAVGIYGLMHYTVSRRMPELGVRMALGGSGWDVARLMLRDCLWLTLAGATCGLVASAALTRVLEHLLFEVHTTDPVTLGGVALLLTLVALAAALLPTLRATRADPTAALRSE
jgi:ABC-type antimicrobial peptide transport system permease subunit